MTENRYSSLNINCANENDFIETWIQIIRLSIDGY